MLFIGLLLYYSYLLSERFAGSYVAVDDIRA